MFEHEDTAFKKFTNNGFRYNCDISEEAKEFSKYYDHYNKLVKEGCSSLAMNKAFLILLEVMLKELRVTPFLLKKRWVRKLYETESEDAVHFAEEIKRYVNCLHSGKGFLHSKVTKILEG